MTHRGSARATVRSLSSSSPRLLLAAIALVALTGAGCANTPAETGDIGDRAGPTGPPPGPAELQELLEERRESSRCMRENGVEDFPDPDADGHVLYYGDDPDMTSASEKCDALLPEGQR
ncbi:hypothetical protein ACU61A_32775 [Pseudonocardia sichuanensis]